MRAVRWMLRLALYSLLLACGALWLGIRSIKQPALAPFPLPQGRATYQFVHHATRATAVLTWDEAGNRYRQETQVTTHAPTRSLVAAVAFGDWESLGHGADLFMRSPGGGTISHADVWKNDLWMNALSVPYLTPGTGAGERVGQETVLGHPCEIRRLHSLRVSYWRGLPLKIVREPGSPLGALSLVATSIDGNPAGLTPALFQIPPGVTVHASTRNDPFRWTEPLLLGCALFTVLCLVVMEWSFARRRSDALPQHHQLSEVR